MSQQQVQMQAGKAFGQKGIGCFGKILSQQNKTSWRVRFNWRASARTKTPKRIWLTIPDATDEKVHSLSQTPSSASGYKLNFDQRSIVQWRHSSAGQLTKHCMHAQSYSSVQQGRRHVNKGGKRSVPSEYTPPMSIIKLKRVRYAQQKQLQRAEQRAKSAASLQKKRRDYRENMVVILKTILHSSNKDLLLLESVLWGHPGSPDASTLLDIPPTEV